MRQQRVKMDQFDRNALLQYHQQAITHALAPQQSQKQMPCQLVFPDDTMAIGSPAVARGALFPTDADSAQESIEERQRRLLQNEPIVVYTSLSDEQVLRHEIAQRGVALLLSVAVQTVCIIVVLTGGAGEQFYDMDSPTPSASQAGLYCAQLALHVFFMLSMYLWSVDMLMVYTVLVTLLFFLMAVLALRSVLDIAACALCVPAILLGNSIRDLMMPHCFMIRS
mmetsp:Transcript_88358/g.263535  ORF Transcript_88358/g.263535 Transcript_88358/m.263535 type:complete len:224 (-) Transcript_88358:119-790(-)